MALSTKPYKGSRDFYPSDKRLQKHIFGVMRSVAERYGYEEYDAPLLEPYELYEMKSGSEIVNEQTYFFEDKAGRKVAIRPEMTPSVSRMVASKRQDLQYPLRLYSIPNLWRYERPQRGRLREHFQLNVDLFGVAGLEGEQEVIEVADSVLRSFGAKKSMYVIKLSSRVLINFILADYLGLDKTQSHSLIRLIDHMARMDYAKFAAEVDILMTPGQRQAGLGDKLLKILTIKSLGDLPEDISKHESVERLNQLIDLLQTAKITNVEFDIGLVRGFDYYTDIVFEVFDTNPDNNRSMFGGGRYDGLIELFGVRPVPTIGFGMGDVTLLNFLEVHNLLPELRSEIDLYVCLAGEVYKNALPILRDLRGMFINVSVDTSASKLDRQLRTADKLGYKYVLIIGKQEIDSGQYKLKNLQSGKEESHGIERIVSIIKDERQ